MEMFSRNLMSRMVEIETEVQKKGISPATAYGLLWDAIQDEIAVVDPDFSHDLDNCLAPN